MSKYDSLQKHLQSNKNIKIKPPIIPLNLTKIPFSEEDSYSDCCMENCTFNSVIHGLKISRARLRNVRFESALIAAEFEDIIFDSCDFSNVDFQNSIFYRTEFQNCKMTGVNLSEVTLKDTRFDGDILQYAGFRFGRFERVSFTGCKCSNADFADASFKYVEFADTDLRLAQMSGTTLDGIDFTTCDIDGLGARPENMRGSIITTEQAVTAAKIMGITIQF